jgi:hypothetical protein
MSYTPPDGDAVYLRFSSAYTAPDGDAVYLRFGASAYLPAVPDLVIPAGVTPAWRIRITGTPDSLPDATITARSWQGTRNSAIRSSYAAVVCNAAEHLAAIQARPNGELVIEWGWSGSWWELIRVAVNTVRRDRGPYADTITASGYATIADPEPYAITLAGVYRRETPDGKQRRWLLFDPRMNPGFQVIDGATSFLAEYLTYNANPRNAIIEVGEYQT